MRTPTPTRTRVLALAGGAVLLLAGCGSPTAATTTAAPPTSPQAAADGRTGPEVAADAADALEQAGAVHVVASYTAAGVEQALDLHLQDDDVAGTVTMGGRQVRLVVTRGTAYAQGSADALTGIGLPAEVAGGVGEAWVELPPELAEGFATMDLPALAEELRTPDGTIEEQVRTAQRDGVDVLVVARTDGSTLTVAAGEPAYPLRLDTAGSDGTGTLEFSGFGERATISAPDDAIDPERSGG